MLLPFAHTAGGFDLGRFHPPISHFPIALLVVAVLFDLAGLFPRLRWGHAAATACVGLGFIAALVASNVLHPDPALTDAPSRTTLGFHELAAQITQIAGGVVLLLRIAAHLRVRGESWSELPLALRLAFCGAGVLVAGAVVWTGYLGGELTYVHGVGLRGR